MRSGQRDDIIAELRKSIFNLQGIKHKGNSTVDKCLQPLLHSFPNNTFPLAAIHEFLAPTREDFACTSAFINIILSSVLGDHGTALWINSSSLIFPPSLVKYGVQPDRIIFIEAKKQNDVVWIMEEALKCESLSVVLSEMNDLSFLVSRRLQLAVEKSNVTGFVLRRNCTKLTANACVSRWKIHAIPSITNEEMPGVGAMAWKVDLLKIRNGRPTSWNIQYQNGRMFELSNKQFNADFQTYKHSVINDNSIDERIAG